MSDPNEIEHFHGVYLLTSLNPNPRLKGRTYIGYTVNPNRRIKQHNRGLQFGGAKKTSDRGPWEMILIIHGFPNDISALRFEWAWQHPYASKRLRHVRKKSKSEKPIQYTLRILGELLRTGPWYRLPLTIRWLKPEYACELPDGLVAPLHMPIAYGPVRIKIPKPSQNIENELVFNGLSLCSICNKPVTREESMTCLNPKCLLYTHVICLAGLFVETDEIIPIEGKCPSCQQDLLWGDLVRKKKGCYQNLEEVAESSDSEF